MYYRLVDFVNDQLGGSVAGAVYRDYYDLDCSWSHVERRAHQQAERLLALPPPSRRQKPHPSYDKWMVIDLQGRPVFGVTDGYQSATWSEVSSSLDHRDS